MVPIQTAPSRVSRMVADAVVGAALGRAVVLDQTAVQDQQARAADEEASLAILTDRVDAHRRDAVAAVDAMQRVAFQSKQAAVGADPQPAASIFEHHTNEGIREAFGRAERAEGALCGSGPGRRPRSPPRPFRRGPSAARRRCRRETRPRFRR